MKPIWVPATALIAAASLTSLAADPAPFTKALSPARVVQPIQEYFTPFNACGEGSGRDFTSLYTHIGTDFGRMGPNEQRIEWVPEVRREWVPGGAHVDLQDPSCTGWTGMWHSLAGLAVERDTGLDFLRCYPPFICDAYQPRCIGVRVRASGYGQLKVELKSVEGAKEKLLNEDEHGQPWVLDLHGESGREEFFPCRDLAELRHVKFLNWVVESGSNVSVDQIGLVIEYPPMSYAERVFLTAYAKLARCYVPGNGIVKDHQHREAGAFDALPATGMFALATAAAWRMGMVERSFAEETLRTISRSVQSIGRAEGLLPHFVERPKTGAKREGAYRIHPGTEYSTVDTSLYYHGMLLAAQMLCDTDTFRGLLTDVKAIRFDHLRDKDGWISHGLRDDGHTSLGWSWTDWGGETALVLLLDRMAGCTDCPRPKFRQPGKVPGGIGFIGEVQSLFYRDFNEEKEDALTQVSWHQARFQLLQEQLAYFKTHKPDSAAAKLELYGLSAGEGYRCRNYVVNGVQYPNADLIHPHYVLMSAPLRPPDDTYKLLQRMESHGLMPPWGMVENVKSDLTEYSPILGSLNAAFECLGAYHLSSQVLGKPDFIYQAACESEPMCRAVSAFYPGKTK
jgi:hypothetical protein